MAKVHLQLNIEPFEVESFIQFKAKEGHFLPRVGFIDTGASVSLFPLDFLHKLEHKLVEDNVEIVQAGISGQYFKAVEAEVILYLEDLQGNTSSERKVRAWFANTDKVIIGFQDILEHATLFIDYRQTRLGWIELD
jgi:hypothetical protein